MTVAGFWANEYGSRMALAVEGDAVSGIYDSTTGATGRYLVTGRQAAGDPGPDGGQPVSLAIAWHPVDGSPRDAGWHWTSALGGQISIVDGEERLVASHLLIATSDLAGLCRRDVYCDKLVFRRVGGQPPPLGVHKPATSGVRNPLGRSWRSDETGGPFELRVRVTRDTEDGIGFLQGTLTIASRTVDITGFTDIDAATDGLGFQSVAITAVDLERNVTMALGGWIDDTTGTLTLQLLTNQATSADGTWLQTAISPLQFTAVDGW